MRRVAVRMMSRSLCAFPQRPALSRHLESLVSRHAAIETDLAAGKGSFSAERMREHSRLSPIVATVTEVKSLRQELGELRALASDSTAEQELRDLAQSELADASDRLANLEDKLIARLVPPEEGEESNAVIEVRAGVGGLEAGLFAGELLSMYERFAKLQRWRFQVHDRADLDQGGMRDATASIQGHNVYGTLRYESGVHRVQRVPATESLGRVHTSTAVVVVLPDSEPTDGSAAEVHEADVAVETFRASGAGGQHVNTTDSAVRLTHKPTGIKVSCQNERSQHMNKATAFKLLRARVAAREAELAREQRDALRADVDSVGLRSERIRTYNYSDDRVSDHRLRGAKHGIPRMLEGELLEEIAEELAEAARLERTESFLRSVEAEMHSEGEAGDESGSPASARRKRKSS